ncbi:latrophilin Cirl-like isoform X4 [Cotesia glomerata]|uniref:latrophilin Cirl-like isoform X4 n=1 Tax=Cotesia glomerata TaxID=32391 RepID=UPI001D01D73C|nr:latrophilin Cirl-like isoform X4 [Cotesia glomerata]
MECGKGRRRGLLGSLILVWFFISDCIVATRERERSNLYDTAYECEGKTLRIECGEGELIHLIRANYGRFSITICNEHGNTDWSVNCMAQKSFRVLYNKCNLKQNCSITASPVHFGDPCPSTLKYLEAHYQCQSAATTTTTSRPSPPWLITTQPSVWTTGSPSVRPPSRTTSFPAQLPAITTLGPSVTTPSSPASSARPVVVDETEDVERDDLRPSSKDNVSPLAPIVPVTTEPSTEHSYVSWKTSRRPIVSTSIPYTDHNSNGKWHEYNRQVCPPTAARQLIWNATRAGEIALQSCPGGANGLAKWKCVATEDSAVWFRDSPDLSECRTLWLTTLDNRVSEGDTILSIAPELAVVTDNTRILYGGDMMTTTKIIRNMAEKMSQNIRNYQDPRQREVSVTELLQSVVRTGSNLLDTAQMASWKDLSHQEQMRVATSLLIGLEENAFLLAETLNQQKTFVQQGTNILMEVRVLEIRNIISGSEIFPPESVQEKWTVSNNRVELSKQSLLENSSEDGIVRLVFMAFDRLEEILQPQIEDSFVSLNEEARSPRNISNRILNSKVISASLGKGRHMQLSEPVRIYFEHLAVENVTNPTCVYWDYVMSVWSEQGCRTTRSNETHTVCECNHLTNFAVLMDVHAVKLDMTHQVALQIVTYVGCIISVVCLVLTIMTFQLFRGLKSDRTTIHKNLCVCLLIAEVLFVCGIGQTDQRIVCGVVAGLLHFFFLCAFAWMFLEGFQLYVMLIEVFEAEKSRLRWYYLIAYGGPLLVVAISCIIDPLSYGTDRYCWLRADNYFIFSFVGPVILVILANVVFLSMAIYMMCRHASTAVSMKSKEHSRLASASGKEENALPNKLQTHLAWLRGAIMLVFLLGLTWTFGLLYLNQETVIMAYLFTALNSLQGMFIFVFHCIQNEKVRKEYRKFIRRHSWLPKCLRCSKTVTGSSGGGSSGTSVGAAGVNGGKDFSSHNTSSNPSAPTTDSSGLSPHAASNNISFKSYSRDSGHGGSEQEESPRTHNTMTLGGHTGRTRGSSRQLMTDITNLDINNRSSSIAGVAGGIGRRAASPYNHTYTEIRDGSRPGTGYHTNHTHVHLSRGLVGEDDPVYEEIERNGSGVVGEIQVSDMSDEDGRRQSDMSRQSSRSYGDHRPLIPYSPANDRNFVHYGQSMDRNNLLQYEPSQYSPAQERTLNACWEKLRRQQAKYELGEINNRLQSNTYGMSQPDHTRTVAVLDGHTVVCHLQPQTDMYTGRGVPPPSYSEC